MSCLLRYDAGMTSETGQTSNNFDPTEDHNALKQARAQLDEAVSQEPGQEPEGWLRRVQEAGRALFDALYAHQYMAEEDEQGTLPQATNEKPALMALSKRLEHEHADMLHRAAELEEEAERQIAFQDYNTDLVRLEAIVLRDVLLLHLLRTDTLLYEAYFQVEGGEEG